jgi:hypothetical protein
MSSEQNHTRADAPASSIELTLDGSDLISFLEGLLAELSEAPEEIRQRALDFVQVLPELVSFEQGIATGTMVPLLLKPSQWLLDFRAAIRTGNFDLLIVE